MYLYILRVLNFAFCVKPQKYQTLVYYPQKIVTVKVPAPTIRQIEIDLNRVLRKIWHLPRHSHTGIAHCVAQVHH